MESRELTALWIISRITDVIFSKRDKRTIS